MRGHRRSWAGAVASVIDDLGRMGGGRSVVVMTDRADESPSRRPDPRVTSVVVVDAREGVDRVVAELKLHPAPDLLVDATSGRGRTELFRATFWAVADGGAYAAVSAGPRWSIAVRRLLRPSSDGAGSVLARRRHDELVASVARRRRSGRTQVVVKAGCHRAIVRHREAEQVLSRRFGAEWGEVLHRREPYEYASRATVVMHGEPAPRDLPSTIVVPELSLRRYRDVTCHVREIVTRDDLVLPDTYRHWQDTHLFHKRIAPASADFGRLVDSLETASVTRESGTFYSLDSAFPAHFGHLMTETLSKVWGLGVATDRFPGIRPVMTHQSGKPALPRWKADVLEALGIRTDDILFVREGQAVEVESLVAAMPQLVNPRYVDRSLAATWDRVGERLAAGAPAGPTPERIFVSRGGRSQRACTNADEVERFFASLGFAVVLPEHLPLAEQVRLFRGARVVAGFAGSGLFNAMFNPDATMVVLSSQSYVAANEYLIAAAAGHEIHYFWAPAAVQQPRTGFAVEAYRSRFEFPLAQHRDALTSLLAPSLRR